MRARVRLVKDGIPGGPPCISVNIDSNLKNEWDCYRGKINKRNVSNNIATRISLELNWEHNILLTSGGSFCTDDINKEIICNKQKTMLSHSALDNTTV